MSPALPFPLFLSVILVLRNEAAGAESLVRGVAGKLVGLATDHELIVVDNASDDESLAALKALTLPGGVPNLQVFALSKEVDADIAVTAGLENALGDFVAVLDPFADDASYLRAMLEAATAGQDVVYASNLAAARTKHCLPNILLGLQPALPQLRARASQPRSANVPGDEPQSGEFHPAPSPPRRRLPRHAGDGRLRARAAGISE